MIYYVYGSPIGDKAHSVWRMTGEGFNAEPLKVRGRITGEHAKDVAGLLAEKQETVAVGYALYNWLWYRVKEGHHPTLTYAPPGDSNHFVMAVQISVPGRDDREFLATSSAETKALFDLVESMAISPLPDEMPIKSETLEPPHNGRLVTFYQNIWVGDELHESNPVTLAEVPAERFKGTGTIVSIDSPQKKRVRKIRDDGVIHYVWKETGRVDKVEIVLESTRKVAQPVEGYVYCQFHFR